MSEDDCFKDFNKCGNILISDQFNNRVVETNERGEIVWSYGLGPNDFTQRSIIGVNDSERVGEFTLMAGTGTPPNTIPQAPNGVVDNRVILVSKKGRIVWVYGQFGMTGSGFNLLNVPVQCTFVPCRKNKKQNKHGKHDKQDKLMGGKVLITDQGNNRIIKVNAKKEIVWSYPGTNINPSDQLNSPNSAEQLDNGNVLIGDLNNNRAIEVNKHDRIVATFTANGTLGACAFASRLPNGNTLLTDSSNSRIIEVDKDDNIVWAYYTNGEFNSLASPLPTRGLRLKNGNTIISDQFNNRVIIINKTNTIVAYYGVPLNNGTNSGYDIRTVQLGLYAPYDAKVICDYTGITKP